MEKEKISVIVSVYNTEKYVKKCIDSILNQTYSNLELVLIDDKSTDKSLEILREYKNNPKVILIENQENKGLSYSRNIGLKKSHGDYIGYIDSDDYIEPDYYEKLMDAIQKEKADIAVCDMKLYYEKNKTFQISRGNNLDTKIGFIHNGLAASACNKLFKRKIMEKYPFAEGKVNEDIAVVIPALVEAKKIVYVQDVYYYYVQRENSIQNSNFSEKRFDIFAGVDSTLERIKKAKDFEAYKDAIVYNQIIVLLLYVFPKIKNRKERKRYLKKYNELSAKYNIRQNSFFWEFLDSTNTKSKIYYKLLFKLECNGHYFLANQLISFLNFFQKYLKKKIIPKITNKMLVREVIKNQRRRPSKYKISVVVPNYNYARFLKQRLYSILKQKIKIYEILILDDCSTDTSRYEINSLVSLLENYINIRKIYNDKNSGSAFKQWEKGFEMACGDYVWIAEADDYCDSKMLKNLVKPLNTYSDIVISYCDTAFINAEGKMTLPSIKNEIDFMNTKHWNQDFVNDGKEEYKNYAFLNCTIANVSSTLIKKDYYHDFFELSGQFKQAGDWLFYVNIMQKGKIAYSNKTLNYYRVHGNNVSSITKKDEHLKELEKIYKYFEEHYGLNSFQKKQIKKRISFLKNVWHLK